MTGPATYIQTLTTKVNYLASKLAEAETAWRAYVTASNTYEATAGARPYTARQSWGATLFSFFTPAGVAMTGGWALFDRAWSRQNSNAFLNLRTSIETYEAVSQQETTVTGADAIQRASIASLKQRGNPLRDRGLALVRAWAESGAGSMDPHVISGGDAFMRLMARASPLSRWASEIPSLTTPGTGGSATGASSDPLATTNQQQGLPPWVMPVAGGILIVGIGFAMWQYSKRT